MLFKNEIKMIEEELDIKVSSINKSYLDYSYCIGNDIFVYQYEDKLKMLFSIIHEMRHIYQQKCAKDSSEALCNILNYEIKHYNDFLYLTSLLEYDSYRYSYYKLVELGYYYVLPKELEVIVVGINDYVYDVTEGLGIVERIINDKLYIKFKTGMAIKMPAEVFIVADELYSYIVNDSFENEFSITMLERGKNYYKEDKVLFVVPFDKTLNGTVTGTESYNVKMSLDRNNKLTAMCNCKVSRFCKHCAATLYKAKEVFLSINKTDNNSYEEIIPKRADSIVVEELKLYANNYLSSGDVLDLDQFRKHLSNINISVFDLVTLFDYLLKPNNQAYYVSKIAMMFYYSEKYHDMCVEAFNRGNYPRFMTILRSGRIYEDFKAGKIDDYYLQNNDCTYLFLANGMYSKLLNISINYTSQSMLKVALSNVTITEKHLDDLKEYFTLRPTDIVLNLIYNACSTIELKKKMLSMVRLKFIDNPDIDMIPSSIKFEVLSKTKIDEKLALYIIDNFDEFKMIDAKKAYNLLFDIVRVIKLKRIIKSALTLLELDAGASYILEFAKSQIDSFHIAFDEYYIFNEYQFSYLNYEYTVECIDDVLVDTFLIYCGDTQVLNIQKSEGKISFMSLYQISEAFVNEIYHNLANEPINKAKYNDVYNEFRLSISKKKRDEYLYALSSFSKELSKKGLVLKNDAKVHLEYKFCKDESYRAKGYTLELKIGNNKKSYIVKDVNKLLSSIRGKETVKYGKELEFNHQIDNFDDLDKPIINYLLSHPESDGYNDRFYSITPSDFDALLELLKGRVINYDLKDYLVRLDEKNIEVSIDENYILNLNTDKELIILNNIYLLDKKEEAIDVSKNNKNEELIRFVDKNKGMDVSLVKDEFIDAIYSRYFNAITVSESIKPEFRLTNLRIDAYFDYVDKAITLETKLYKDDIEITSPSFLTETDKYTLAIYLGYIEELGFEDSKYLTEQSLILNFFYMDFSYLKELCNVYLSDTIKSKTVEKMSTPTLTVSYDNNMMQVFLNETIYDKDELYEIMKAIRQKKSFVLLRDDRILDLTGDDVLAFADSVNDFKMDIRDLTKKRALPTYEALKAYAHKENVLIDEYVERMISDITTFKDSVMDIPKVNTTLRDYQKDAYKWLSILTKYNMGGILADDMGLGKTLEFITLIKGDENLMPSIVVCPKSLIFNWYSEFEKFYPECKVKMIFGSASTRHNDIKKIEDDKKVVYITAYDSLRNDIDHYEKKKFNYIILDEAQAIKNSNTIKSHMVRELKGMHRFAMTGTPIENNVFDLWSIFDFIMPGYLDDLQVFRSKYMASKNYTDLIAKKIAPFILRRTKKEVLKDLPEKFERILSCEMTTNQRKIYDAHVEDAKRKLESSDQAFDILPYLTRLRQICVDPKTFIPDYSSDSGKISELKELIPEYIQDGHRILLFSSFVKGLNCVMELLDNLSIKYYLITGDTKANERMELTKSFNENEDIKVFLISLKAGGTGLNLTGADTVIHLDPWWNVSAENQASDRAHRIGQKRNVEVIKLVALDSIEQKVIELQNLKKDIIDKLISNDDSSVTSFSIDDIKYILEV